MGESGLYEHKPIWKVIDFFLGFFGTLVAGLVFFLPIVGYFILLLLLGLFIYFCAKGHYYLCVGFAAMIGTGIVGLLIVFGSCLITGGQI